MADNTPRVLPCRSHCDMQIKIYIDMKLSYKIEPRVDRPSYDKADAKRENPLYSFRIRVGTKGQRVYIPISGVRAGIKYWDSITAQFDIRGVKNDKQLKSTATTLEQYNELFISIKSKCNGILQKFDEKHIPATPLLFAEAYNSNSQEPIKIASYFEEKIESMRKTNHIGNANCYSRTLHMLRLYDSKFDKRYIEDVNIRYVTKWDEWMQMPRTTTYTRGNIQREREGCDGNTRKYYHKTLRALLNKAITEGITNGATYPYGKGGFSVGSLEEETEKRYLSVNVMSKIKSTILEDNPRLDAIRRLFVCQYLCHGMAFTDIAHITTEHIKTIDDKRHIEYKREKTKRKKARIIKILIRPELQEHIDWFAEHCPPVEQYIFPVVTIEGYKGEQLYNHIRNRYRRYERGLKELAKELGIEERELTSYVSRHTMAMTLRSQDVAEDMISQILGHADLKTTKVYLDSFDAEAIAEATKNL